MNSIQEYLSNPATKIIDVRSPSEFASEHLPNALNIPVETLQSRAAEIIAMNAPVLVYCRSGARSAMAESLLRQAGLSDVVNGGSVYDLLFEIQNN